MSLGEVPNDSKRGRNWIKRQFRPISEWIIRNYPAFAEVVCTVLFTFTPIFLVASLPWTRAKSSADGDGLLAAFLRYWESGEIALPILGLCGASFAILLPRAERISTLWRFIFGIVILITVLVVGFAISESNGFKEPLDANKIRAGFGIYAVLALVWMCLIRARETAEPSLRDSGKNSQAILEGAKAQRSERET